MLLFTAQNKDFLLRVFWYSRSPENFEFVHIRNEKIQIRNEKIHFLSRTFLMGYIKAFDCTNFQGQRSLLQKL